MTPSAPTTKPRRFAAIAVAACLLSVLIGTLATERAEAGTATILIGAHQNSNSGVDMVYVNATVSHQFDYVSDGACALAMTKLGRGAIGKVTIYKEASTFIDASSCGFQIPRANLTTGSWMISVNFQSDAEDIDVTGYDSITVT